MERLDISHCAHVFFPDRRIYLRLQLETEAGFYFASVTPPTQGNSMVVVSMTRREIQSASAMKEESDFVTLRQFSRATILPYSIFCCIICSLILVN